MASRAWSLVEWPSVARKERLDAVRRLSGRQLLTPESDWRPGVRMKREDLQLSGSFKYRGALNVVLAAAERGNAVGLLCVSTGNTARACASVGRDFDLPVVAVVPTTMSPSKRSRLEALGCEVLSGGREFSDCAVFARETATRRRLEFVSPGASWRFAAGLSTLADEILVEELDAVIVPVGGGGLLTGMGLSGRFDQGHAKLIGVQAALSPSVWNLIAPPTQRRHLSDTVADCLAGDLEDGALIDAPGSRFPYEMRLASEHQMVEMARSLGGRGVHVEPGAACALTVVDSLPWSDASRLCVVITGDDWGLGGQTEGGSDV